MCADRSTDKQKTICRFEVLRVSGEAVEFEVLADSRQDVECEVLTHIGQIV